MRVVDRFVHIVRCPHNAAALDKRRYIAAVVVGIWLTVVLANSPLLALYRVKAITSPFHESYYYCALDSHEVCGGGLRNKPNLRAECVTLLLFCLSLFSICHLALKHCLRSAMFVSLLIIICSRST